MPAEESQLTSTRVAMLVADGAERTHAERFKLRLEEAGARVDLVGPRTGEIWAMDHLDKAATFPVDVSLRDAAAGDFDCLVIPGGVAGVDHLRRDPAAVALVFDMIGAGKPVAAAGHAPWLLIEAGVVRDRTLTASPSLRTDIVNGGGQWLDEGVAVDANLLTCRRSEDLEDLVEVLIEMLG